MSEKAEAKDAKKAEAHGEKGDAKEAKGGGMMSKTPVLLGAAMVMEAVVLFAGFKFLGAGARHAAADVTIADAQGGKGADGKGDAGAKTGGNDPVVELPLLDFKATNKQSGRVYIYNAVVVVTTKAIYRDAVEKAIKDDDALIKDRVRTIIAQSDADKLGGAEPGLETLRRQIKAQLDEIIGDGKIDDVLVPSLIPYPAGF
jgi:flagellar basal body-associated protein FliL